MLFARHDIGNRVGTINFAHRVYSKSQSQYTARTQIQFCTPTQPAAGVAYCPDGRRTGTEDPHSHPHSGNRPIPFKCNHDLRGPNSVFALPSSSFKGLETIPPTYSPFAMVVQMLLSHMCRGRLPRRAFSPSTILLAFLSAGLAIRHLLVLFDRDAHVSASLDTAANRLGSWLTYTNPRRPRSRVLVASSFGAHDDGASRQSKHSEGSHSLHSLHVGPHHTRASSAQRSSQAVRTGSPVGSFRAGSPAPGVVQSDYRAHGDGPGRRSQRRVARWAWGPVGDSGHL